MSENLSQTQNPEDLRIHDPTLAYIGACLTEAAMRSDLEQAAADHVLATGVTNPNSVPSVESKALTFGSAEVPMNDRSVYRQVHKEAVQDLADSGVVRNGRTAVGEKSERWGDRVFWNSGEDGKKTMLGGRTVIEASKAAAQSGWVTADKVTGVFARDVDGKVKNLIG